MRLQRVHSAPCVSAAAARVRAAALAAAGGQWSGGGAAKPASATMAGAYGVYVTNEV